LDEIIDLSTTSGFGRLYKTLIQDGGSKEYIADILYDCYCSNISAYNKSTGCDLAPLGKTMFSSGINLSDRKPYRTDIQTIKALTLLEWNMDDGPKYAAAIQKLCDIKGDYTNRFYQETGYTYTDTVSSYSLCEDTLDPIHEPAAELNPAALLRKHDKGTKFVYISAPLRGDVEKNIAFAKKKAREVFDEGHIPICPHLMFPPIADPTDSGDDERAMQMCLKLMERCDEVRVYGPEWTEGMHKEIRHADRMKIPMYTDQKEVPRSRPVQKKVKTKKTPTR